MWIASGELQAADRVSTMASAIQHHNCRVFHRKDCTLSTPRQRTYIRRGASTRASDLSRKMRKPVVF